MTTREDQLEAGTQAAIEESKGLRYNPTDWIVMVRQHGALEAHKRVLRPGNLPSGFVRLAYDLGRPDLTAEYAALHNYPDLFTEEELAVAQQRLRQM